MKNHQKIQQIKLQRLFHQLNNQKNYQMKNQKHYHHQKIIQVNHQMKSLKYNLQPKVKNLLKNHRHKNNHQN